MKNNLLLSLMLLLAIVPQSVRAEYYGIMVGGVSVTSDNCNDITSPYIKSNDTNEDYYVRYDPSTKTLTLKNISISRKGSGNRALLNESCDGLTIVLDGKNYLGAYDSSPVRLNANTTIKGTTGMYGYSQQIVGYYSDGLTIGNAASLVVENVNLMVQASKSCAIDGNTGSERLVIMNSYVHAQGEYGIKDLEMLGIQTAHLRLAATTAGARGLTNFRMIGRTMFTTKTSFNSDTKNFINTSDNSEALEVTITSYVNIDETNFPDENFRSEVSQEYDVNGDGRLSYNESKIHMLAVRDKNISSLQGVENFPTINYLYCEYNNLTTLDISKLPYLTALQCNDNQLTSIRLKRDIEINRLEVLLCRNNRLTSLDLTVGVDKNIDCSYNQITYLDFANCAANEIIITYNRINEHMTQTLQSLPSVTQTNQKRYRIEISNNEISDNVCTAAQARIARNKGWNAIVGGIDTDGNIVYNITIAGNKLTSANAQDLTTLPGITKNNTDGYAKYNPSTNTLFLNGVDIENQNGQGIAIELESTDFTIIFGQEPVNITSAGNGLHAKVKTLTITTEDDWWYSQKLKITSRGIALYVEGNLVLNGATRIQATGDYTDCSTRITKNLTIKNEAELRIKAHDRQHPIVLLGDPVLENDIIILTPEGAYFKNGYLNTADGKNIKGKEVVIGKLRNYNCYVAGTRITNANQHAVLGDTTIIFQEPAYDAGPGTLILTNANIESGSANGIETSKTLYIKLIGSNTINSKAYGIRFTGAYNSTYIDGPGSLNVTGLYGIDCNNLYITDTHITAQGTTRYAIDASEATISGTNTILEMKSSPDARGTFRATSSLILSDGLVIGTPEGAQYIDGEIKDTDGNIITDQWVIIASQDNIDGISEVKEDSQMVNGKWSNGKWYNLAGQMVNGKWSNGKWSRGIIIQGGRKYLVK